MERNKKIVLVPVGICLPTTFVRCPSLFANKRCHISFVLSLFISFLYVIISPVSGSKIVLDIKGMEVGCPWGGSGGVNNVLVGVVRALDMILVALLMIKPLGK